MARKRKSKDGVEVIIFKPQIERDFEKEISTLQDQVRTLRMQLELKDLELKNKQQEMENSIKEVLVTSQTKANAIVKELKVELREEKEAEVADLKKYASQKLLSTVMPIIDNIEIAINFGKSNEAVSAYVVGFWNVHQPTLLTTRRIWCLQNPS